MPYITLNKRKLYYAKQDRPSEGAPNVLLVHGAGGNHLDWPPQLRRLPGAAVYAIDLFGHGRSDKPGRDDIEEFTDDVFRIVEELSLNQVVVVGHSLGGAIAQTVGLRKPEWASGLVLIGSGARLRVASPILNKAANDLPAAATTITSLAWAPEAPADLVNADHLKLLQADPTVLYADFSACDAFDVLDRLEQIELPTLIVCGSADRLTPIKYSKHMAQLIPGAELFIVEGAGHMVALEQPVSVASAVQRFVARIANSG